MKKLALILPAALILPGCIAKTAIGVVTAPVKATSQAADWATTSQDESDRNSGREMRKQQEREAKAQRKACKEAGRRDCG